MKKQLKHTLIFALAIFIVSIVFDLVLWGNTFGEIQFFRTIFVSLFSALVLGVLIRMKIIKTK